MEKKYNFDKSIDRRMTHSYKWDVPSGTLSFSIADTDFEVAQEIVDSIKERSEQSAYGYTYVPKEYFDAYIYWWNHRYGLYLSRDWFIFSTGVVASIDSIIKRTTKVGDSISLFSPNYNVFYNCIENNKRIVEEVPFIYENYEYSIDWDLLEQALAKSKMFILCNPHNPIGKQFTEEELTKISNLCERHDVYLITDEIHADLDYNKKRYNPFYKFSNYKKAIMLISPSKSFNLAGLHSSVIIIRDDKLRQIIQKGVNEDDIGEPSYFSIDPVIIAFTKCEQYIDEENDYINENKRVLSEYFIKNDLKLKIVGGESTYLLWVDISYYYHDSEQFVNELKSQKGIVLVSGKHYHEHFSSFVRINIATQRKNILHLCKSLKEFLIPEDRRKTMNIQNYEKNGIQFIEVKNSKNLKVVFANLGASIYKINFDNYVMTRNVLDPKDFYVPGIYHGKTVGRVSNRIKGHKIKLHDVLYSIEPNEGNNVLHGGPKGISNMFFDQNVVSDNEKVTVLYTYTATEESDGFPGNLSIGVKYIVYINSNEIDIEYTAKCDKDTVVSLTNHSYFTLGCRSIKGLTLQINADNYLNTDNQLLAKSKEAVTEALDFREPKKIFKDIEAPELHRERLNGYDHFYYFNNKDINVKNASLSNAKFVLDIYTNFEGLQIYSSGFASGIKYYPECEGLFDSLAVEPSDSFEKLHLLKKDNVYSRTIKYIFSVKE